MSIELTYTQCKQIVFNGWEIRDAVNHLNDIPEWCYLDDVAEIQSIAMHGCASNAHISCFYKDAKEIFNDNTSEIEEVLEHVFPEPLVWDVKEETFEQFTSKALQIAVEGVANTCYDMLYDVEV